MTPRTLRTILVVAIGVIWPSLAIAELADTEATCESPSAAPSVRLEACDRIIADPGSSGQVRAIAWFNHGNAQLGLGDAQRALAAFDAALALDPNMGIAWANRGIAHRRLGSPLDAVSDYTHALNLGARAPQTYENRGLAFLDLQRIEEAIRDFDQAIVLAPDYQHAYNSRCWALTIANRNLTQALADCDRAVAFDPNDDRALDSRGLLNLKLGRYQQAYDDYSAALRLGGSHPFYLFGRGVASLHLGLTAQGRIDIEAATALDRSIETTFASYGVAVPGAIR